MSIQPGIIIGCGMAVAVLAVLAQQCFRKGGDLNWLGRIMAGIALCAAFCGVALYSLLVHEEKAERWVAHTETVIGKINEALFALVNAQTGQRGYLLTQRPSSFARFMSNDATIGSVVSELRTLVEDNPPQEARATSFASIAARQFEDMRRTVDLARRGDMAGAMVLAKNADGYVRMETLRGLAEDMKADEQRLLGLRQLTSSRTRQSALFTALSALIILIAGLAISARELIAIQARRLAAEAHLRESNRSLNLGESTAHVGSWRLAHDTNALTWSDEVFRIHGLEARSGTPSLASAIGAYHTEDRKKVATVVSDALAHGKCFEFSARIVRPDGEVRDVVSRGLPECAPDGALISLYGSIIDVTDLQRAERAIVESEARYRLLAEHATDLIIVGHPDGRHSYISPAVHSMLGYSVNEAYSVKLSELIHPADLDNFFATTCRLTATEPIASLVYRLRTKTGAYIWAEAALRRVNDGNEVKIISAIRDVTERERYARHLEKAREAAEAGARIKSEFLANMSHELRTPLTGMLGINDLLQSETTLSDRQRHLLSLAQASGRALLAIVNDVLDFSKIEAGQMTIEQIPFMLRDLIESCRDLAAGTIEAVGVTLTSNIVEDTPNVFLGDPGRIRQVLLNLTTNAIKFTASGVIEIHASWMVDRLRLSVSDTGIGIARDLIPHLFERFSQADGSTTRRFGGTGLGLAICKRLVELMGGFIEVESTEGMGSTFAFELPLRVVGLSSSKTSQSASLSIAPSRRLRLLVAEDNIVNQEIIVAFLKQKGHDVTLVTDGAEAVERFRRESFDVVLMDVQMPNMDGLTATREIRKFEHAESRHPTPIVALTANAMAEEIERCRIAGTNAHVAKPIDWTELFSTIHRLCNSTCSVAAEAMREPNEIEQS